MKEEQDKVHHILSVSDSEESLSITQLTQGPAQVFRYIFFGHEFHWPQLIEVLLYSFIIS